MAGGFGEVFRVISEKGEITKEEFSKLSDEMFKKLDTNGDGKITKEELEGFMSKAREMRGSQGGPQGDGGVRRRPEGNGAAPQGGDRPKRPEGT